MDVRYHSFELGRQWAITTPSRSIAWNIHQIRDCVHCERCFGRIHKYQVEAYSINVRKRVEIRLKIDVLMDESLVSYLA